MMLCAIERGLEALSMVGEEIHGIKSPTKLLGIIGHDQGMKLQHGPSQISIYIRVVYSGVIGSFYVGVSRI